ncbi:MAG: UDP-glucose--hexose-1-phosphate uridylyltransferase [Clostridia bacterium]|nr:UDP-glucose--hexose-1-phosphate uridylyltransferase [Clostridia bacterium]
MKLCENIYKLTEYGVRKKLIEEEDRIYTINSLLQIFKIDDFNYGIKENLDDIDLDEILNTLTDIAFHMGLIENDEITQRDLFDTKLMGVLTKRPSEVIKEFWSLYDESPEKATDYFYEFCKNVNYIRTTRVEKDKKWKVQSKYGEIDISINLSKPEKDPKAIAAAGKAVASDYPKCQLCIENEGYAGRSNHPARENHRIIPITIDNSKWGLQYSPYVYYNEHCIVLNSKHTPMKIESKTFEKLFDFVESFPHYFLGSNADLPIVGGSILSHDHFQGGRYTLAMEKAEVEKEYTVKGYENVSLGILNWPLSVIRLRSESREKILSLAELILNKWRNYTDEEAFVFANTNGEPHNTITPIARMKNGKYELDLALRNNITTKEFPLGVYHPHSQYHNIKKENIGLIEVMGLAILPSRLEKELELIARCITENKNIDDFEDLLKHKDWIREIKNSREITSENVMDVLKEEVGKVFVGVLEDTGVFKCTKEGRCAFEKFIKVLSI